MTKNKQLSNSFSTGGGGGHFEAHVQASFTVLMLSGGHVPCLPCWPIVEIKLQGKIDGFDTDDLIVKVECPNSKEQRKLLGQVKHSISVTQGDSTFGEVMLAAWNDFNNPTIFTKGKDIITLITGPISATDSHNVQWLLNQARHTKNVDEFLRNVQQSNFSPQMSTKKLEAIQYHLKAANSGNDVSNDELYEFLRHFYLLGYDLGKESGVVLSLLHSHISQFQQKDPQWVWARVVDVVQTANQSAGTINSSNLPEDLVELFKQKPAVKIPEEFKVQQEKPKTDWTQHPDATYLVLVALIGAWQENNEHDLQILTQLLGIEYTDWSSKAKEILHHSDSPLTHKNGSWKVVNRTELLSLLGSRIFDQNLDTFKFLATSVLKEVDPAFELPAEERHFATIHDKVQEYSNILRKGIAEGAAILGSQPEYYTNCSAERAELTSMLVIHEVLTDADCALWGSLNSLLPTLAEAAPKDFLDAVEKTLLLNPCPFDELFSQEGIGIMGDNYLTGLLWALEGIAWDEQYLVRVCVVLAELASHDPGGNWSNRPSNSLATILLPWLPQTLASVDKCKVAVQTVLKEWPEVGWNLIIQLLPSQHGTSFGSHKPVWRTIVPEDWKKDVTRQEYWELTSFCAELAVSIAGKNIKRLCTLMDSFDRLPEPAFSQLLEVIASQSILELPEKERLPLWKHLRKIVNTHRKYSDEKWALPCNEVDRIEQATEQLSPNTLINSYQYLFTERDVDLYEEEDWEEQCKKLQLRREEAISKIFQQDGLDGVIEFSEAVSSVYQIGYALGVITDSIIEETLLPNFLGSTNDKYKSLVSGFIWRRYQLKGWTWCDGLDKLGWTPKQLGQFLTSLPFSKETWDRVSDWLQANESEYWKSTAANTYQSDGDLTIAIEKLIEHGRPFAAIDCLNGMRFRKQPIDSQLSVKALLTALSSDEPSYAIDRHKLIKLIEYLQEEPSVNQDDLFQIEWAYLPLLDRHIGAVPRLLESKLANDPVFFCEVIQLVYRSKKEKQLPNEHTEKSEEIAKNAWKLLYQWKTPPGVQKDGTFSSVCFNEWLEKVKEVCTESGHLQSALYTIGKVLIHAPADPTSLWIHRTVATALNEREFDDMRYSFEIGLSNSRGVHTVDISGEAERRLAEDFRKKADDVENEGFQRIAVTLRNLADKYDREAKQVINDYNSLEEGKS